MAVESLGSILPFISQTMLAPASAVSHACVVVLSWMLGEIVVIIFVFFAHKKYSRSFIQLRLNQWCHVNYFIDVLNIFLALECGSCVTVVSTQGQKVLRFHKKFVFLFVFRKWTMVLHVLDDGILFLEWTIPLIDLNQVGYHIEFYMDENNAVVDKLTVLQWHALFKGPILTTDLWCFYLQIFFFKDVSSAEQ